MSLPDTGAVVYLIHPSLMQPTWRTRVKLDSVPRLRTATRKPLEPEGLIIFHLRFGEIQTRVWFGIALHLGVGILLDTKFIDHFIRRIFLS